jgi:hypothetical protein
MLSIAVLLPELTEDEMSKYEVTWRPGSSQLSLPQAKAQVPKEKEAEFEALVRAARFFDLPQNLSAKHSAPHAGTTKITISDGQRTHTLKIPEAETPQELANLYEWIESNLR